MSARRVECVDRDGRRYGQHSFLLLGWKCERCGVTKKSWDETARARRAGLRIRIRDGIAFAEREGGST